MNHYGAKGSCVNSEGFTLLSLNVFNQNYSMYGKCKKQTKNDTVQRFGVSLEIKIEDQQYDLIWTRLI